MSSKCGLHESREYAVVQPPPAFVEEDQDRMAVEQFVKPLKNINQRGAAGVSGSSSIFVMSNPATSDQVKRSSGLLNSQPNLEGY